MTDSIVVQSKTQRIIVGQRQSISVTNTYPNAHVSIVEAGPIGPPGVQGTQGPPGVDAATQVDTIMEAHINDSTPHPVYDDVPNLVILFENGLY